MVLPLAANISTVFLERDFLDRIDAAAEAGFDAVECQFPYAVPAERIAERLRLCGMTMEVFNAPPGDPSRDELGLAGLEGREAEFRGSIEQVIDYASALAAPRVHVPAGRGRISHALLVHNLAWAAERVGAHGVTVLTEPLNPMDRPGYSIARFETALDLIAAVAAPNFKLMLDLYHWQKIGELAFEELLPLLPLVGHVQFAAVPDRGEPRAEDVELIARLEAAGYNGPIGCEYFPRTTTVEGLGWLELVRRMA